MDSPAARLPEDAPLVALRRGAVVESVHRGRLIFCDPAGNVLDATGDPDAYLYPRSSPTPLQALPPALAATGRPAPFPAPRSSAKPFRALPLVLSGAADAFGLTDEELAVACASHNAEAPHLAAVRSLLEKARLPADAPQDG